MTSVVRTALSAAVAGFIIALSAHPAAFAAAPRHHHRHHVAGVAAPVVGHAGHDRHHAAVSRHHAHAGARHGRDHGHGRGPVAKGRHARRHHLAGAVTHRRHASLCQTVTVRRHSVERCRG